jgi:hypothetical protein
MRTVISCRVRCNPDEAKVGVVPPARIVLRVETGLHVRWVDEVWRRVTALEREGLSCRARNGRDQHASERAAACAPCANKRVLAGFTGDRGGGLRG